MSETVAFNVMCYIAPRTYTHETLTRSLHVDANEQKDGELSSECRRKKRRGMWSY